jgi:hypothetical protein
MGITDATILQDIIASRWIRFAHSHNLRYPRFPQRLYIAGVMEFHIVCRIAATECVQLPGPENPPTREDRR